MFFKGLFGSGVVQILIISVDGFIERIVKRLGQDVLIIGLRCLGSLLVSLIYEVKKHQFFLSNLIVN